MYISTTYIRICIIYFRLVCKYICTTYIRDEDT